jgi:hypothetical protein
VRTGRFFHGGIYLLETKALFDGEQKPTQLHCNELQVSRMEYAYAGGLNQEYARRTGTDVERIDAVSNRCDEDPCWLCLFIGSPGRESFLLIRRIFEGARIGWTVNNNNGERVIRRKKGRIVL